MNIQTIGVIGAGQMGSGIAQVFAQAGFKVILQDIDAKRLESAVAGITKSLSKFVEKGKLDEATKNAALANLKTTTVLADFAAADFAIEAATENQSLKEKIFTELSRVAKVGAILATNTSSIPISALAKVTAHPEQVIGMHFMNPVPLMKGVEVIRGEKTDDATHQTVLSLVETLKKSFVRSKDKAGFVANRILMPMIREAMLTLQEGVSEKEDIDRCMVDCCNFPMGPLALADLIGLDTVQSILNVMVEGLKGEQYRPPQILNDLVKAGKLGRKSGEGFYVYK